MVMDHYFEALEYHAYRLSEILFTFCEYVKMIMDKFAKGLIVQMASSSMESFDSVFIPCFFCKTPLGVKQSLFMNGINADGAIFHGPASRSCF